MARGKLVRLERLLDMMGSLDGESEHRIEAEAGTVRSRHGEAGATDDSWGSRLHVAEQEGDDARVKGEVRGGEVCAGG